MEGGALPSSARPTPASSAGLGGINGSQQTAKRRKVGSGRDDASSGPGQGGQQHYAIGPAEDDAVIRQRLLTRTTTTRGEPPLKKLLKKFFAFASEVDKETSSNIQECEKLYRTFLQELSSFELPLLKTKVVIAANRREQENFKELQAELSQKILETQADIENLKVQLEESKIERQHKEECEAIRRLIGAQPARSETQKVLDELTRELSALEAENLAASRTLDLRKKQFSLLLHVVDDLQSTIEEEVKFLPEDVRSIPEDLKGSTTERELIEQDKSGVEPDGSIEPTNVDRP
ncbi:hypothetical protein KP509_19G045300 [Ceratopteris richardii]|uniref:THO complex subunit 7A n=1 Tax=Ceratopteris richardii TaxID=49495 RepID=A0A8T2SM00_CERRI|nr:hypothetical protein KP509_19G045300 [Ceratopteris richardii]KAH7352443.1 hypothetical protein KP509_19G045300 [Ceratopteris richardii]